MPDGHHHGCGGCVANPHGEEGCDQHEAQKQPTGKQTGTPPFQLPSRRGMPVCFSHPGSHTDSQGRPHSDDEEHPEGNALVQVPVFHSYGHHHPPNEQYVGVIEVLYADLGSGDGSETLVSPDTYGDWS